MGYILWQGMEAANGCWVLRVKQLGAGAVEVDPAELVRRVAPSARWRLPLVLGTGAVLY